VTLLPPTGAQDLDVAVVDTDPLWRVRFANAVEPHEAGQFERLDHAAAAITRGHPAVLLVGPSLASDSIDELAALEESRPELMDVLVVPELSVPVLQSAMAAGVCDVLGPDATVEAIVASVRKALGDVQASPEQAAELHERLHPGRLVVVTAAKGGEGSTAVAVNLAAHLAADPARSVSLVDGDARFGDVALSLGLPPAELVEGDGLADVTPHREQILSLLTPHDRSQLAVLIPPRTTAPIDESMHQRTLEILSGLQALSDVVVVDAPFRLVEVADLLAYADAVVMVTDTDVASLKNTMVGLGILDRAGTLRNEITLVVNKVGKKEKVDVAAVQRHVGCPVAAILPESDALVRSLDDGEPLVLTAPKDPYARAVAELATKVMGPS
jgi:pilus assembly protein CpaE